MPPRRARGQPLHPIYAHAIPPKEFCPACQERAWELLPLDGRGTIASFHGDPRASAGTRREAPYAVAVVRLDEGVSLLGRIIDIPLDALKVGLPVRFRPLVRDNQTVVGFGPSV